MTDLTPKQRATQIRRLVFDWINLDQKDFPWPALDNRIAVEVYAAEQAAREKALSALRHSVLSNHGYAPEACSACDEILRLLGGKE